MKPYYASRKGYVIVITPHARESWRQRLPNIRYGEVYGQLDEARRRMRLDVVSGTKLMIGGQAEAYLYCRRIFNYGRCREELEIISVTPMGAFWSDGVSQDGHQHDKTEMVNMNDEIRTYCFCCRKELSEYKEHDDKFLCLNHPVSYFRKK
jgi:hypothetical protein